MARARKPRTFLGCLRQFLTPAVFRQAHSTQGQRQRRQRWQLQPLLFVLLTMTWCCGDSMAERFETAKGFYVACHTHRRRPGKTEPGFEKALARLPLRMLRALSQGVRRQIESLLGDRLLVGGFIPLGCDGSRVECPRSEQLEQRLGEAGKEHSAPSVWVTAVVHLRWGLLWCWRLGKGTASETWHLTQMIAGLPPNTLLVCDAAYFGYELAQAIMTARLWFLIRVSSSVRLYTESGVELERFVEGVVYYWPQWAQAEGRHPLRLRLLRIRSARHKCDVWLLTNVLDAERLSLELAGQFYRWRWENEGLFRTYKRTLRKLKLLSRTVRLVHREAEGSLLALQILLAAGVERQVNGSRRGRRGQALSAEVACSPAGDGVEVAERNGPNEPKLLSPRQALLEIRREIRDKAGARRRRNFAERLAGATRERRRRQSSKEKRVWPRRKSHTPPKAPQFLTMTTEQKSLLEQLDHAA